MYVCIVYIKVKISHRYHFFVNFIISNLKESDRYITYYSSYNKKNRFKFEVSSSDTHQVYSKLTLNWSNQVYQYDEIGENKHNNILISYFLYILYNKVLFLFWFLDVVRVTSYYPSSLSNSRSRKMDAKIYVALR